jgi:hypothetical protein
LEKLSKDIDYQFHNFAVIGIDEGQFVSWFQMLWIYFLSCLIGDFISNLFNFSVPWNRLVCRQDGKPRKMGYHFRFERERKSRIQACSLVDVSLWKHHFFESCLHDLSKSWRCFHNPAKVQKGMFGFFWFLKKYQFVWFLISEKFSFFAFFSQNGRKGKNHFPVFWQAPFQKKPLEDPTSIKHYVDAVSFTILKTKNNQMFSFCWRKNT